MELFRDDNTEGYTASELSALNDEWDAIAADMELDEYTPEYDEQAAWFSDSVSRR